LRRLALAAALLAAAGAACAEERPLWELGAGGFFFGQPDYRGADEGRAYALPLPYVVYRGDRFRVDREGIRALLFDTDRVELDLSLYATPPVDSDRNAARQGMADLDPTVEVGPVLDITLARDRPKDWDYRLRLRLPVRGVVTTGGDGAGWVSWPHLNLDLKPSVLGGRWNWGLNAGPLFGNRKYHEYFYGVPAANATPQRPAYQASGGYSGMVFLTGLTRRFDKVWVGGYVRYDWLGGAAFEDSPLLRREGYLAAGIAIAYVFAESSTKVYSDY
jgi:outer membrane scaffolding protein for murein synthesis (MipA/OmpV family)